MKPYLFAIQSIPTLLAAGVKMEEEVLLLRTRQADYRVISPGAFYPLITGYDHLLMDQRLANLLVEYVPSQVRQRSILIHRKSTKECFDHYVEMSFLHQMSFQDYDQVDTDGLKIWLMMGSYIYVTPSLKSAIEDRVADQFPSLGFKLGKPSMPGKSMFRI